jgi:hypothetical protein
MPVLLDVKEKHSAVTCPHIEIKSKELHETMVQQVQLRLQIHANLHSPLFKRTFGQQNKWSVHRNQQQEARQKNVTRCSGNFLYR